MSFFFPPVDDSPHPLSVADQKPKNWSEVDWKAIAAKDSALGAFGHIALHRKVSEHLQRVVPEWRAMNFLCE